MTLLDAPTPTATVTSPAPRDRWAACYRADPTALPTQLPTWTDAAVATGRFADASRHYRFDDGSELVVPLLRGRGGPRAAVAASMPDAWGYGGALGERIDGARLTAIVADLRHAARASVRIRPNPLHAAAWEQATGPVEGSLRLARHAHVLDLDRPADALFAERFSGKARTAVRRAEKAGLEVEVDDGGALVDVFADLLERSVVRWAAADHEPTWLARARARRRDPRSKFHAWAEALGSSCRVLVARRGGVAVAAMVVLQDRNAHMTRSVMDQDLVGKDRANELLVWHAIRGAAAAGCGAFHLGESGTSASLASYKEKFGAVGLDYAEHRLERLPVTRIDASARSVVKRAVGFRR